MRDFILDKVLQKLGIPEDDTYEDFDDCEIEEEFY